ncbi:hypothetical protein PSPO01_13930 [Paraphaeosphaeria sporulosa]
MGARLGYRIIHKSKLIGGQKAASIWRYGAELLYLQNDGVSTKVFFLCEKCHQNRTPTCLYDINSGTSFIIEHLRRVHNVNLDRGLMPIAGSKLDPFKKAAGAHLAITHSP